MNYFFKRKNGRTITSWLGCPLALHEGYNVLLQLNKGKEGKPQYDYFTIITRIFTEDKCILIVDGMLDPFEADERKEIHVH